jgi:TRAP-type mannitol/chloroaromatic compound transport system permease small subunit
VLAALTHSIERVTRTIGSAVAWCAVAMVAIEFLVVLLRHVFGLGFLAMQESVIYLHAATFMLAAAAVLARDRHVRIDIFVGTASSARRRAIVDLMGAVIFLLPLAVVVGLLALPYVARSWAILERSKDTSGLPLVFLLKSLIPAFALLIGLQALAMAARAWLTLTGSRGAP